MFKHLLVSQGIGGRTIHELEQTMDVAEFHRWKLYDYLDPLGSRRLDYLFTLLRAAWVKGKFEELLPEWGKWLDELLPPDDPQFERLKVEAMFAPLEKKGLPKQ